MASFITGLIHGGGGGYCVPGYGTITEATAPEELPSMFAGTDDHADPTEALDNLTYMMERMPQLDGVKVARNHLYKTRQRIQIVE